MFRNNTVLEGAKVRLEPLSFAHAEDLFRCGNDQALWLPLALRNPMSTYEETCTYIARAIFVSPDMQRCQPFAIIRKETGAAIGSTRVFDIDEDNRKAEIGFTWIAQRYWRTSINTECKLLLLTYLFEEKNMLRVQLKSDSENARSRAAMERIGARYEGTLKYFRVVEGSPRSVSFYGITIDDWPDVRTHIHDMMINKNRSDS